MPRKNTKGNATVGYWMLALFIFIIIGLIVLALYHQSNTKEHRIDTVTDYIDPPYLTGNTSFEVDYMSSVTTQSELEDYFEEVQEIYEEHGIYLTFDIDESIDYEAELNDSEIEDLYNQHRDQDTDSYILVASTYSIETTLGSIYNSTKIVIFKERSDSAFGDYYEEEAFIWITAHEIGHAYGCGHVSDDYNDDIMHPYLSKQKLILFDPEFTSPESIAELQD